MRARLTEWRQSVGAQENRPNPDVAGEMHQRIYRDIDVSRFDPAGADDAAWKAITVWRERMDAAVRRP